MQIRLTANGRWRSSDKSCCLHVSNVGQPCRQQVIPVVLLGLVFRDDIHLFDEDLMICIEMLHIRRNLNRPATQASQRAQMARLKQQEQMETVEAQARQEASSKAPFML